MKEKPIAIIITLLGGAVACVCCICKGTGLLWTLLFTLIALFVFIFVGLYVNSVYASIKADLDEREKERLHEEEEARILAEAEADRRYEWSREHPDEPFPDDVAAEAVKTLLSEGSGGVS